MLIEQGVGSLNWRTSPIKIATDWPNGNFRSSGVQEMKKVRSWSQTDTFVCYFLFEQRLYSLTYMGATQL